LIKIKIKFKYTYNKQNFTFYISSQKLRRKSISSTFTYFIQLFVKMIQFQISAPASLSLFGEQTDNIIKASIDLRTTLNFQELNCSNNIEINFPQINLFHKIPLQKFLNLYDMCVEDMRGLYFHVTMLTWSCFRDNKRFLQIFYHLLVRIMYKQQIARAEIKTFRIDLICLFGVIKSMPRRMFLTLGTFAEGYSEYF